MIGWTQDSKPMQLGAPLTKEERAMVSAYSITAGTSEVHIGNLGDYIVIPDIDLTMYPSADLLGEGL